MMGRLIYLDNNATTQMAPEVLDAVTKAEPVVFGNASSMHSFGREAGKLVEDSRRNIAELLDCDPSELIFTSGASEANNTVFMIAASIIQKRGGGRIVTTTIEHPCIMESVKYLRSKGVTIDQAPVERDGRVNMAELEKLMGPDVVMVSVMTGNNETGSVQPIKEISEMAHRCGALMHTDATQAIGKLKLSCRDWNLDYLSCSGHKFYGPKGVGVLYARKGVPYEPFVHGGEQEHGRRAGTYNTIGIYGMGVAARLAMENIEEESAKLWAMREKLRKGILGSIPNVTVNGCTERENCLPGTLDVSFENVEGESILLMLDMEGIAVSTGSACATGSLEPSYVLLACGLDVELAHGSIRFSFGRFNTMEDVDFVLQVLPPIISRLRAISTR
ncbi:MAG: aminotransferase class V-fold PLP-dependent enzyme [Spirochaetales bacterium]|nr:aminotransferase class V-fold PLP-dependent enzyme [Spirochaetales bacterium]MBQ5364975.1 aminotransferase class V-fold PLP-dependent enzyme [Spirochaetales bacterium]